MWSLPNADPVWSRRMGENMVADQTPTGVRGATIAKDAGAVFHVHNESNGRQSEPLILPPGQIPPNFPHSHKRVESRGSRSYLI